MKPNLIEIKKVNKKFANKTVLQNINLNIKQGEILTIIGHSGSGKTTLLRCLNLLERPDSGEIIIDKKNILDPTTSLSDLRTKVGMVFQNFNLFEAKTVLENCCLALIKVLKLSPEEAKKKALSKLSQVGMESFANEYTSKLSGGQKQRVAIARALCMSPKVLLLDEPTSALDPEASQDVFKILQKVVNDKNMTLVIITHEMKFARKVAHNICFMADGKIVEKGTPSVIFETDQFPRSKAFFEEF